MKNSKFFTLLIILLSISLLWITGCEEDNKDSDPTYTAQDVAGAWSAESMSVTLKIKSSTNQNGVNPLEEGNGGVAVTGDVNGNIKYSLTLGLFGQYMVMASNVPLIETLSLDALLKPSADTISLNLNVAGTDIEAYLDAYDAGTYKELMNELGTGLGFNTTNYAISANQAPMASDGGTLNATLNGTLTPEDIDFDKDKFSTVMNMPVPMTGDEALLVFNEDGTFTGNLFWEDIDEAGEGQWSIDGNDLTVSMDDLDIEGLGDLAGELEAEVEMDGNDMIVTLDMELLELVEDLVTEMELEGLDYATVKAILESVFGMDMGSMSDMVIEAQFVLTPTTVVSKDAGRSHNLISRHMLAPVRSLLRFSEKVVK